MKINFRVNDEGKLFYVSYDENMTVEEFIKDFLRKNNNYVTLDTKVYTFRSQSKILNSPKFLKNRLNDVINNDGQIYLIRKEKMGYTNTIKLMIKI